MYRKVSGFKCYPQFMVCLILGVIVIFPYAVRAADEFCPLTHNKSGIRAVSPQSVTTTDGSLLLWSTSLSIDEMKELTGIQYHPVRVWQRISYMILPPHLQSIGPTLNNTTAVLQRAVGDICACTLDTNSGLLAIAVETESGVSPFELQIFSWVYDQQRLHISDMPLVIFRGARDASFTLHNGNIYLAYSTMTFSDKKSNLTLSISKDKGQTWSTAQLAEYQGNSPKLISDGNNLLLFFQRFNTAQQQLALVNIQSIDHGLTWSNAKTVIGTGLLQYSLTVAKDHTFYLLFSKLERDFQWDSGACKVTAAFDSYKLTSFWLAKSNDVGNNWSTPKQLTEGKYADHYPFAFCADNTLLGILFARIENADRNTKTLYSDIYYGEIDNTDYNVK